MWVEDGATAQGRVLHERVDADSMESHPGERDIALRSLALGLSGKADAIGFYGRPPRPVPVEYKRGKPKPYRADDVQLCAQALCLEEMFGTTVLEGALFYGAVRRRTRVVFDAEVRALRARIAAQGRGRIAAGRTPPPVLMPGCKSCSLQHACQPGRLQCPPRVARWLAAQMES